MAVERRGTKAHVSVGGGENQVWEWQKEAVIAIPNKRNAS